MDTTSTDLIDLFIPSVGKCTLFPSIEDLRGDINTYYTLYEVAKHLNLREIPARSHKETQEIWRTLASTFEKVDMVNVRVLISGVHDSYPSINTATKDQKLEQCVTAMDICIHSAKKLFGTCNPFVHHVEMTLDEVPLHEEQTSDHPFYCLFLSAPER